MLSQALLPTSPAIREWEQAGSSLAASLDRYLDLTLNLKTNSLREGTQPHNLTRRIDVTLQSLHTVLDRKLSEARSTLARTRNEIISRAYSLPHEILTEIFLNALYTPITPDSPHRIPMTETLLQMFPDLYRLQQVCRMWRDIIVSRGLFWYFAPIYRSGMPALSCTRGPNLSLQRAKGDLYLAAVMHVDHFPDLRVFRENVLRFRKVNLIARSTYTIWNLIKTFLQTGPPFSLSELSLYEQMDNSQSGGLLAGFARVLSHQSEEWAVFCKLLKSLTALRIRGAHFSWDHMSFSNRLVELRLQDIVIGPDSILVGFLNKLALNTQLRDLKIISIRTTRDDTTFEDIFPWHKIKLANLESLLLEDLSFNTLSTIFRHIAPGSHRLTLFPTEKSLNIFGGDPQSVGIQDLCSTLNTITVNTLVLLGEWSEEWLLDAELRELLISVPGLKTLKMSGWALGKEGWKAMTRPQVQDSEPTGVNFPELEYLHLSSVQILDEEWMQKMVMSHSIRKMVLGGSICTGPNRVFDFDSFQGDEPIVDWFRLNVPDFRLVDYSMIPPEYFSYVWQLW